MLNITLTDKTAKLLESYRRSKRLSREKALEVLLEDVTERQALQNALTSHWAQQSTAPDPDFETDLNNIIKQDRAKQRSKGTN
jgi:hypothetical protein